MQFRSLILAALVALVVVAAQAAAGVSASERWIVFSALPKGLPPAQLFRVQTTGTGLEQITSGTNSPATQPAFSPGGTRVVFARLSMGIFVMNLDGSGLRRLTSGARDSYPVWSPNGKRIAFLRVYRTAWRLYTMNASGKFQQRLPLAPPGGRPSWTADGKSIFLPLVGGLARVDARTGSAQKRITMALDLATSQAATLSPNSKKVAWVGPALAKGPPECGEVACPAFALYLANVPGRAHLVVRGTGPAGWSPDGKTLVFVYRGALNLWPVAGGARTPITTGSDVAAGDAPPAWQPR